MRGPSHAAALAAISAPSLDARGINWHGVPPSVRNDDTFQDLASQCRGVDEALPFASGSRRRALFVRHARLISQMRVLWDVLTGAES